MNYLMGKTLRKRLYSFDLKVSFLQSQVSHGGPHTNYLSILNCAAADINSINHIRKTRNIILIF